MKNSVSVPFVPDLSLPCANLPISLPYESPHTSLYFGFFISCRNSNISPVAPSNTAPAKSHKNCVGYFLDAVLLAEMLADARDTSNVAKIASCVMVRGTGALDLVLLAGASSVCTQPPAITSAKLTSSSSLSSSGYSTSKGGAWLC